MAAGPVAARGGIPRALRTPLDTRAMSPRNFPALRGPCRRTGCHPRISPTSKALTSPPSLGTRVSRLGTSCPDHFLRTRICPFFVDWDPGVGTVDTLKTAIRMQVDDYRHEYRRYYDSLATPDSPKLRDSNPSVVIIPGIGLFGFGRNKKEARIATEFFLNAINVMQRNGSGTTSARRGPPERERAGGGPASSQEKSAGPLPQARQAEQAAQFEQLHNYVALPRSEAFRIEYWALEEAKLQRMPAEAEFSRKIVMVVGGGSGIGREVALLLARKGAHVVVADAGADSATRVAEEAAAISSAESVAATPVDLSSAESLASAAAFTVLQFGGIDGIVNTAAIYPVADQTAYQRRPVGKNVSGTSRVITSRSANQWIVKASNARLRGADGLGETPWARRTGARHTRARRGNHLIRELASALATRSSECSARHCRLGFDHVPRDRVMQSLQKYNIAFEETESTEDLRDKLAEFYAQRTLTRRPILPRDCANAIVWLLSDDSAKTTGHIIPVDGGLTEAFLR